MKFHFKKLYLIFILLSHLFTLVAMQSDATETSDPTSSSATSPLEPSNLSAPTLSSPPQSPTSISLPSSAPTTTLLAVSPNQTTNSSNALSSSIMLSIEDIGQIMKIIYVREQLFEGFFGEILGEQTENDSIEWDQPIIHLFDVHNRIYDHLSQQAQHYLNELDTTISKHSLFTFNNYQLFLKTRRELKDVTIAFYDTISIVGDQLKELQTYLQEHKQDIEKALAHPLPQNIQTQKPQKKHKKKGVATTSTHLSFTYLIQTIQTIINRANLVANAQKKQTSLETSIFTKIMTPQEAQSSGDLFKQNLIQPLEVCSNEILSTIWHKKHMSTSDQTSSKICAKTPYSSIALLNGHPILFPIINTMVYSFALIKQAWKNLYQVNNLTLDCFGSSLVRAYIKAHVIKNLYASTYNKLCKIYQQTTVTLPQLTEDANQKLPHDIFIIHRMLTSSKNLTTLQKLSDICTYHLSFKKFYTQMHEFSCWIVPTLNQMQETNAAHVALSHTIEDDAELTSILSLDIWEYFNRRAKFESNEPSLSNPGTVSQIQKDGFILPLPTSRLLSLIEHYASMVQTRINELQQAKESATPQAHDDWSDYCKKLLKPYTPKHKQPQKKQKPIDAPKKEKQQKSVEAPRKEKKSDAGSSSTPPRYSANETTQEKFDENNQEITSAINNLYNYFNFDEIVSEDDNYAIIKQTLDPCAFKNDSVTVVIYRAKTSPTQSLYDTSSITQKINGPSYKQDKFHKISTHIKRFLSFGYFVCGKTIATTAGVHHNFEHQLYLIKDQYALIIPATLIPNNKFIGYKLANNQPLIQLYQNTPEKWRHLGAYVFIVDPSTDICIHACFHETQQSRLANNN